MTKPLHELPENAPLRVPVIPDGKMADAVFGHLDGMYSYCYLADDHSKVFHLKFNVPMKLVDGRWEIDGI